MALDPALTEFTTASQSVTSYDYLDVDDGTGTVVYYITIHETSGATFTYTLERNIVRSAGMASDQVILATATTNVDVTFNTPKTVKGTATISAEFQKSGNNMSMTVTIQKVSGAVVTDISSAVVSPTQTVDGYFFNMPIPLTETVFAAGDTLRLELFLNGAGSGIWADPTGSTGLPAKVLIPFKLDI
jgi:hypothetical protein